MMPAFSMLVNLQEIYTYLIYTVITYDFVGILWAYQVALS